MPYISPELRKTAEVTPLTPGELNFAITRLVLRYLELGSENYESYNDVLGVLSAVGFELYRRRIAAYETKKCNLNGDVFVG